jgi:tetratricopeptide (TPR) repeat protein
MSKSRVDSWKSIADYMRRGVRTVQRWHLDHGLPVYRVGGNKGSVYAYADELDRWLAGGTAGEEKKYPSDAVIEEQKRRSTEAERLASELWEVRTEENLQPMLELYRSAIDQYPDNAAGIAGLANSLIFGGLIESLDLCSAYPSIKAAVNKALQKDPRHLKVQSAVAWSNLLFEREWKQADRRFTEILRVNPAFGPALFGKALLNLACEDPVEATRFARACWSAEPMGTCQGGLAAICMVYAGDIDGAARLVKQVELTGASCDMLAVAVAMVSIHTMHPDEALTIVQSLTERHARSDVLRGLLGYAFASAGRAERAEKVLENLYAKRYSPGSWYAKALVMSKLGRIREAVDTLKQRSSVLSLWRFGHRTDRLLAPLNGNVEFREMIAICFPNNFYHSDGGRAA